VESKLSILDKYKDLTEITLSNEYWIKDAQLCKELQDKAERLEKSMQMTHEKFARRFNL